MYFDSNWAAIVPMANEEKDFNTFIEEVTKVLNRLGSGTIYLVVDKASKDRTLELCQALATTD